MPCYPIQTILEELGWHTIIHKWRDRTWIILRAPEIPHISEVNWWREEEK